MRRLGLVGACFLLFCAVVAACSSSSSSAAKGSIDIAKGCVKLYGSGTGAVGKNGHGTTGWYCQTGGDLTEVTVADLQKMCADQYPGTQVVNVESTTNPQWHNSQWRCLKNSASNTNSVSGNVTINNGPEVSTMQPGVRFTTVPWFQELKPSGRPYWLPLYAQPWQTPPAVNKLPPGDFKEWPCEYYDSNSTAGGPFCLSPPKGRTPSDLGVPGDAMSGDRLLVLCQVYGQSRSDASGTSSAVWDRLAVPKRYLSAAGYALVKDHSVPGMKGYFMAYGPDIFLLNSSFDQATNQGSLAIHDIPCQNLGLGKPSTATHSMLVVEGVAGGKNDMLFL